MRLLLINPPDEMGAMFGVGKGLIQKFEPLGLLYVAAVARDAGHDVTVIDAHAEELGPEKIKQLIDGANPEVIGFSTLTCSGALVYELGKWLKATRPECLVVLGNIHASTFAKPYLENGCADVVVHGDGEEALIAIMDAFENKGDMSKIPSISYRDESGKAIKTSDATVVENISELPYPARDLVNQASYKLSELSNQNYVCAANETAKTMVTSRGCVFRCTFCVVHGGIRPRFNSPERVVDELELLEKEYGTSYVYIQDPLFMGNVKRVMGICDEYRARGLKIKWGCDARVDYMKPKLIKAMAAANCYELSLGIESGVQRHLDAVDKRTTPKRVADGCANIKKYSNIRIEGLFILGFPDETYEEALETIRFACALPIDMAQFSIMTPYPGSPLFTELSEKGELETGIRADGTIDTSVWRRFSSYIVFTDIEPIWTTPSLSYPQLRKLQKKALRSFYLRPRQVFHAVKRLRRGNLVDSAKIAVKGFF